MNNKRNRLTQEQNQLLFIQQCLLNRLESRNEQRNNKLIIRPIKQISVKDKIYFC